MPAANEEGLWKLERFPPRFHNAAVERTFLDHQLAHSLPLIRLALAVGLGIYMAFGLVDPMLFEARLGEVYALRFGIGVPAIAAALALSWAPPFHRWHQAILAIAIGIVSATLIAQVAIERGQPYYVGLILVMFFVYQFLRIRYLLASAICLALVLACSLLPPLFNPMGSALHVVQGAFLLGGFVVASLIAYIHEISARREYRQRSQIEVQQSDLYALAYFDQETGLPNRRLLCERLNTAISEGGAQALAIIGVRLKEIYQTYGRDGGERLLASVAARLQRSAPLGGTVARLDGGNFGVSLGPVPQSDTVANLLEPLYAALDPPIAIGSDAVTARVHIGVSTYPDHGREAEELIQAATTAMNAARNSESAQARWLTYAADMSNRVAEQLQLEEELAGAVRNGEFVLYYQPQIDLRTGATFGVEALLRWQHPRRGLLAPDEFLATLDESGLLNTVGHWTLEMALAQYQRWLREHGSAPSIAINLSPRQIHEGDLLTRFDRAFADYAVPPGALRVEVTESAAMIDPEHAIRTLEHLRMRGIESALDDFGKGYSSLNQVRYLPVSTIKIDKSFMAGYPSDTDARALVESVVQMAHHLGKDVLAEGVESELQRKQLARIGCDYAQGALNGMPMPPNGINAAELAGPSPHEGARVVPLPPTSRASAAWIGHQKG